MTTITIGCGVVKHCGILTSRFPKMQQALSRTSYLMQDASEILEEVLKDDWQYSGSADYLDLTKLSELSFARQRQLLSAWMKVRAISTCI